MCQNVHIGFNSIENLGAELAGFKPTIILLVRDRVAYEISGAKRVLDPVLENCSIAEFYDFELYPKLPDIERGISLFGENDPDLVIAVGGGSVIDTTKSIAILANHSGSAEQCVKGEHSLSDRITPLIAIPTTAGTGSEATHFAVVYNEGEKYSLAHPTILPDVAIVDPQFTRSLPPYHTASTGMDALAQAIESYWSIHSTSESKRYAAAAITLIMTNLETAVNHPDDTSRESMAMAAHLAGKAINIAKTTAPHAVSYPMTSYFDLSHGHAVGLTLARMMEYNTGVTQDDLLDKRGVAYVQKTLQEVVQLTGAKYLGEAAGKIDGLMTSIGLSTRLHELRITREEDFELIVKHGFNSQRVRNNPRELTESALRRILGQIR